MVAVVVDPVVGDDQVVAVIVRVESGIQWFVASAVSPRNRCTFKSLVRQRIGTVRQHKNRNERERWVQRERTNK